MKTQDDIAKRKGRKNSFLHGLRDRYRSSYESHYDKTFSRIGKPKLFEKNRLKQQALISKITQDGNEFRELGNGDGWRSIAPLAIEDIAYNLSSFWKSFIQKSFRHRVVKAKSRLEDLKSRYDNINYWIESLREHKMTIDTHYKYHSKHYSLLLGLLYVAISVVLLMAEFPLAKQSASQGFNMGKSDESFWFAFGIILITAFIKIFYDEYLGNSIQKTLLNRRAENMLGSEFNASKEELKAAKRIRTQQFYSKLLILLIVLATLLALGFFRYNFLAVDIVNDNPEYAAVTQTFSAKWAFILTSILFPIISGICVSVGFRNLHNFFDRKFIVIRIFFAQLRKNIILRKKSIAEGKVEECEANLNWVSSKEGFVKECSEYFYACYIHGYNRGITLKMPDDFYDVAEYARSQHLIQNSSALLSERFAKDNGSFLLNKYKELNPNNN